jgi:hypothetical protein
MPSWSFSFGSAAQATLNFRDRSSGENQSLKDVDDRGLSQRNDISKE